MTQPTRWLRRGIAAMAGSLLLLSSAAYAGAPQVKTQAPGFYRVMLGDFEVTALFDGTLDLEPKKLLTNTTQAQVGKLLDRSFEKDAVPTSVNGYLINTGSKLVLVDTGAGGLFGPTLGNLQANLKAAGYQPEQVDDVLVTHMHGDHVGGLVVDGKLAFPNATIHAGKEDADFWLSKANLDKASGEMKGFFQGAMASLNPYVDAGKFKPITGNTELLPGIKAVAAHGHTPGHNVYVVESKGQKLVLWGDLMHVAAVQFVQPQVTISFDVDSKSAAVERKKAYADAAKGRYLVGSAHLPFPGLGHIRAEGKSYVWVPVDYQQVR
ncbi:MBL fold metallo-hydrolase [Variovorax sp. KBW07]|uniref:MBL fold metallo-hydrolase n=1 Tax=Variovorax sp. KBW07 TaxID=2153358 RepID=UPI000F566ACB|nr:MBL fold metallo-hydrolase [Variovorax sp. KBW07]RQO41130.1 MBL fold metallo-hydrolase [Variovorax sp. KBW07]